MITTTRCRHRPINNNNPSPPHDKPQAKDLIDNHCEPKNPSTTTQDPILTPIAPSIDQTIILIDLTRPSYINPTLPWFSWLVMQHRLLQSTNTHALPASIDQLSSFVCSNWPTFPSLLLRPRIKVVKPTAVNWLWIGSEPLQFALVF